RPALFGMSKAAGGLPALACVPVELKGVARALQDGRSWRDRRFTARALCGALAEGADIVHIATHHHLVPGSPTRSFLLLGDGERLPIAGFFSGDFAWAGVDLVFLSGCETAAGDTAFEGGDTMAAAFHQAGVADVIATVWPAADEAASRLAPRFYREIAGGAPRAEALRRAQLALLAGDVEDSGESPSIQGEAMRHPAHWAPFKLFVRGR
ncbi:MAG: CHAT domain-containing protein, partial [Rhizobiales bacterium]|nr:CHAT domain-containing protein [Hyphomicrobiales bacterium]